MTHLALMLLAGNVPGLVGVIAMVDVVVVAAVFVPLLGFEWQMKLSNMYLKLPLWPVHYGCFEWSLKVLS